jgi:hypothetical protein
MESNAMAVAGDYTELIKAIESAGRFTTFRPEIEGGQLVCVSHRDSDGRLHGNSFLVLRRRGNWYISTWGDAIGYLVPFGVDIRKVCLDYLAVSRTPISDVPESIVRQYGLIKKAIEALGPESGAGRRAGSPQESPPGAPTDPDVPN